MNNEFIYPVLVVFLSALITWLTRALPFMIFRRDRVPNTIKYLGDVLPAAIMVVLVAYCLKGITFSSASGFVPEIASAVLVVLVQYLKNNMYLSIILGTVCYMVLIRII